MYITLLFILITVITLEIIHYNQVIYYYDVRYYVLLSPTNDDLYYYIPKIEGKS